MQDFLEQPNQNQNSEQIHSVQASLQKQHRRKIDWTTTESTWVLTTTSKAASSQPRVLFIFCSIIIGFIVQIVLSRLAPPSSPPQKHISSIIRDISWTKKKEKKCFFRAVSYYSIIRYTKKFHKQKNDKSCGWLIFLHNTHTHISSLLLQLATTVLALLLFIK